MQYLYFKENVLKIRAKTVDARFITEYGEPIIVNDSYILTVPIESVEEGVEATREKTRSEIEAEQDYAIKRQINYPSIGDQLDALFKAGVFPEEMTAQIRAVKDANPK